MKEINKSDKGKSGIYLITNLANNKVYVGQSIDLWTRINEGYLQKLPKNKGHNRYLQRSWIKYGEDNFKFEVIEYVEIDDLNERETFWIKRYQSCNNKFGYNMIPQGGSNRGQIVSEETRKKISKANKGKNNSMYGKSHSEDVKQMISDLNSIAIVQLDVDGNFIKEWKGAKEAADYYDVYPTPIRCVLRKKTYTSCGFIWVYKDEYDEGKFNIEDHFKEKSELQKPVIQFDVNGNFIKKFNSISHAFKETNIYNIWGACNNRKIAGGYFWMYKETYDKEGFIKTKFKMIDKGKKVMQFNLSGELINIWDNVTEASKKIGCTSSNISSCCNCKQKSAFGYIWIYESDYTEELINKRKTSKREIKQSAPVIQLSLEGDYIQEFYSIKNAGETTNISRQNINSVCKGKTKTAGGFKWIYKEEYSKLNNY